MTGQSDTASMQSHILHFHYLGDPAAAKQKFNDCVEKHKITGDVRGAFIDGGVCIQAMLQALPDTLSAFCKELQEMGFTAEHDLSSTPLSVIVVTGRGYEGLISLLLEMGLSNLEPSDADSSEAGTA